MKPGSVRAALVTSLATVLTALSVSSYSGATERERPKQVALATGVLINPRPDVPPVALVDDKGLPFTARSLKGSWSLLLFGYANCPDVCPTTLSTLAAMRKLTSPNDQRRPRVIFVSGDTARDTPAALAHYVHQFHPEFQGVTAQDQKSVEVFASQMGAAVVIRRLPQGSYAVDHSAAIFVIDPLGRIAAVLTGPFSAKDLQHDVQLLLGPA